MFPAGSVGPNALYFGDNLEILRDRIAAESVDLIYLDPPFNSNQDYNFIFKDESGRRSNAQVFAFEDTWHWTPTTELTYAYLTESVRHDGRVPSTVGRLISALRDGIGENQMLAYLVEMAVRLIEMRIVLKPSGVIYLHCDPTASHYLKLLMDAIFGIDNYFNEITWKRTTTKNDYRQGAVNWPRIRDVLLHYRKDSRYKVRFNQPFTDYSDAYVATKYRYRDTDTRAYRLDNLTAPGAGSRGHPQYEFMGVTRFWRYNREKMEALAEQGRIIQTRPGTVPQYKRYLDEMRGIAVGDDWDDIAPINSQARERLDYPTQKPLALLQRIIEASSQPGDLVLDPFCGCGTAIVAAHALERRWIGIDITTLAVTVMLSRLRDSFGAAILDEVMVDGLPKDVAGARFLAEAKPRGRQDFELWALALVGARPSGRAPRRGGADRGIDGLITFTEGRGKLGTVIVSIKSGDRITSRDVRDLKGTVEREKAQMGMFVTLRESTSEMRREASVAGHYHSDLWNRDFPKLQILTIHELLEDGRKPDVPSYALPAYPVASRIPITVGVEQQTYLDLDGRPIERRPEDLPAPAAGAQNMRRARQPRQAV